jgi:hypothetical protein
VAVVLSALLTALVALWTARHMSVQAQLAPETEQFISSGGALP